MNNAGLPAVALAKAGGEGGIRTHGGLAPTAVFKTAALNHSATSPSGHEILEHKRRKSLRLGFQDRSALDAAPGSIVASRLNHSATSPQSVSYRVPRQAVQGAR